MYFSFTQYFIIVEFSTITRNEQGQVQVEVLTKAQLQELLTEAEAKGYLVQNAETQPSGESASASSASS
jgi:hypothetical protein